MLFVLFRSSLDIRTDCEKLIKLAKKKEEEDKLILEARQKAEKRTSQLRSWVESRENDQAKKDESLAKIKKITNKFNLSSTFATEGNRKKFTGELKKLENQLEEQYGFIPTMEEEEEKSDKSKVSVHYPISPLPKPDEGEKEPNGSILLLDRSSKEGMQEENKNSPFIPPNAPIPPPIPVGFSDALSPSNSQNIPNGNSSSTVLLFPTHQGQPTPLTSGNLPPPIPSIPTPINTVVPTQPKSNDNDNKSYDSKYWCCDRYNNNCNNVKAFHDPFIKRKLRRPPPKFIGSYSIEKSKGINGQCTTCQSDDIQSEQNNLRDDNEICGCTVM